LHGVEQVRRFEEYMYGNSERFAEQGAEVNAWRRVPDIL